VAFRKQKLHINRFVQAVREILIILERMGQRANQIFRCNKHAAA